MGTRPRLPNNVIWSIEDATSAARSMWEELERASKLAEKREDVKVLAAVNECMSDLASVEHHLRNARQGRYEPRGQGRS